jgi:hypothetical protein
MALAEREYGWLQQRQRQSRFGAPGSSEQDAQATVGMPDEVSTMPHEFGDVVGIN